MVSLGAVETEIRQIIQRDEAHDDVRLVAVNLPDEKKGEKVVLLIEALANLTPDLLRNLLVESGLQPLMLPAKIFTVDEVPVLGSGKTDYPAAKILAETAVS
ncbi:hypothetical protein [Aliamphritea spongicola]|nr:hypothetical protein [Aliamphritea spongicola]